MKDKTYVFVGDKNRPAGRSHWYARKDISERDIELMKQLREMKPPMSFAKIAEKFEISKSAAWQYVNGARRGHVTTVVLVKHPR